MDPVKLGRIVRRLMLPVILLSFLAVYLCFDLVRVPSGMDTLTGTAGHPPVLPGSTCIIDKRASSVVPGMAVFVEIEGGVLLSRVHEVTEYGIVLRHDNEASQWVDSRRLGPVPMDRVVGSVMVVFPSEELPGGG